MERQKNPTSWEPVQRWYQNIIGEDGHYYHRQIVLPGVLKLLERPKALLDLACGNGILARQIPQDIPYTGIDISPSFIKSAQQQDKNPLHTYIVSDVTKRFSAGSDFSHASLILAAQNLENPLAAFQNAANHLKSGGKLILVINHPCYRIPRQSSWGIDEERKIQYRRVDRYHSALKIPIQAHPSQGKDSPQTYSFHHPLADYSKWLYDAGFAIELMEEWYSDKQSTGKKAKMENRSREEIPLFLAIRAIK
jgi:SAM-dependent methyltransferase